MTADCVDIVEVGPRDGFQSIGPIIATEQKVATIRALHATGLRRIEVTSFVSPKAVPQMADAIDVVAAVNGLPDLNPQVLVPSARHAERALLAGARHLAFVLSVSESHNRSNVCRSPDESVREYADIASLARGTARLRLNIATAFDCPFEGKVGDDKVLNLLDKLLANSPDVEIALCDTTGRANPTRVHQLFATMSLCIPQHRAWAFHAHDTFGLGAANALMAWNAGVRVFDSSVAGLGGCPFAPGATGNVATEDLVWLFETMGIATGVDLERLVSVANQVADLPGAHTGGRVRFALAGARESIP